MATANEQREKLLRYAMALDQMDYFQILGAQYTATPEAIRAAYRKMLTNFHPDKYQKHPDEQVKDAIYKIAKRVAEAYTVLRDDGKRNAYLKLIQGPERAQHLRYTETEEEEKKKIKEEQIGTTKEGRQYYQQGLIDFKRNRFKEAAGAFQSALLYEPENGLYKQKLDEAQRAQWSKPEDKK